MINLLSLSKFILIISYFLFSICNFVSAIEPVDIWKKKENQNIKDKEISIIIMVGLQGSGKTTTSAKIASFLKREYKKKPLLYHSIKSALKLTKIHRVIVSTDSKKYGSLAKKFGAEVIVRPKNISKDNSLEKEYLVHAYNYLKKKEKILVELLQKVQIYLIKAL